VEFRDLAALVSVAQDCAVRQVTQMVATVAEVLDFQE
jgi:hypothetical protein